MGDVSKNCVNCAIGLIFNFSDFLGISKIIITCNHSNKQIVRKKSIDFFFNLKRLPAFLCLIIIAVSIYYNTSRTYEAIKNNILLYDLILIVFDIMLYAIATIIIVQCIFQCEKLNYMVMFFDSIVKEFNTLTSHCLLSRDDIISFRTRTYLYLIGLCLVFTVAPIFVFYLELDPNWNIIERFGLLISVYACCVIIIIVMLFVRFVYYANKKYKHFLKMDLDNLSSDWTFPAYEISQNWTVVTLPRTNVKDLLRAYSDTYMEFVKILKTLNKCCNPLILILILFVMIFCIATFFLIVVCVVRNTPITLRSVSVQSTMQFIILVTGFCIVTLAKCGTLNLEILTILRKFPISKLYSPDEKLQFYCFLHMVQRYQVNFAASEMVSIDIPLFASVLSTVLTYVLVAVQFEFL